MQWKPSPPASKPLITQPYRPCVWGSSTAPWVKRKTVAAIPPVAEIVVFPRGSVSRYALKNPLIWSDAWRTSAPPIGLAITVPWLSTGFP